MSRMIKSFFTPPKPSFDTAEEFGSFFRNLVFSWGYIVRVSLFAAVVLGLVCFIVNRF